MNKDIDLPRLKRELRTIKAHLQQFEIWFNADGKLNALEKGRLKELRGQIKSAEARITELEAEGKTGANCDGVSKNPTPTYTGALVTRYKDVTQQNVNRIIELFKTGKGDESAVHWNDVQQGALGNCYFLAGIAAVAKVDPSALKRLIKGPDSNGNYQVTLYTNPKTEKLSPTPRTVTITPEFLVDDKGDPLYAQEGDQELWVMLLEKAYALLRGEKMKGNKIVDSKPEGYGKLDEGWGAEAIEALTGQEARMLWLHDMNDAQLKSAIDWALDEKKPITTGSILGPEPDTKPTAMQEIAQQRYGLVFAHEYTILDFDGTTLTLFNPHNREEEAGDGGGKFTLAFKYYRQFFRTVTAQCPDLPE